MRIKSPVQSPRIRLFDLLRRRRASFPQWVSEAGIQTYDQLTRYCSKMGINPPNEEECAAVFPSPRSVTVATEGIVCVEVEPVRVIEEQSGLPEPEPTYVAPDPALDFTDPGAPDPLQEEGTKYRSKKNRSKKTETY